MSTIKVTNLKNEGFANDQLYLKSDGKIGVGVAAPASEAGWGNILHINSASAGAHIRFTDNTSGSTAGDGSYIGHYGNDTYLVNKESSGVIIFNTNASERVRIDSSGRVLIGTTTLGDAYADNLTIADAASAGITIRSATTGIGSIYFADGSTGDTKYRGFIEYHHVDALGSGATDFFRFATAATERLRIDSSGFITQGGKRASNHGSPNLLLWGADPTLHITSTGSTNNSSFAGIKFAVAGGSTGDYSKAGIFVQRQSGYTDLDMIFAFRSTADTAGVAISDEKIRFTSNGNIKASNFAGRNKIINGAMRFNQRGGTHSYAHDGPTSGYNLDRFQVQMNGTSTYDCVVSQETTAPVGFTNSLKLTTGTAESAIAASEYCAIYQKIEGQNLQDLLYNTSSAKTVTMSFWVRSSVTGTYVFTVYRDEGTDRAINRTYTIDTANTWEKKILTIPGDVSGSSIANNNGSRWWNVWIMASGSTYTGGESTVWEDYDGGNWAGGQVASGMMTTAGASFYLTGIQLEIGDTATEFEYKLYDEELASCQRYYFKFLDGNTKEIGSGWYYTSSHMSFMARYPTTMRTTPTGKDASGTNYYVMYRNGAADYFDDFVFEHGSTEQFSCYNSSDMSGTAGQCGIIRSNSASSKLEFDAEL